MVLAMRDPGVIRLVLLGGVDAVDAAGTRIEPLLAQPRRLALLAMLAIESMHGGCPRERLMATFWPEHPPAAAAANLRQAVAFLRGLLGDEVIAGCNATPSRRCGARAACRGRPSSCPAST